ncbi:aminoglycoside phosphotransferase [Clostridium sartagoforme AAU1]|uniref:Aminoglycoside phosphotransferase n=1 Tax=Clostridium sartagoforme AAU1 TaxID=1202534 RepID=R9CM10_9CLOT|nr:aminoglycoside phosphotransferase family protein [Clostridium sartagoforme]EOR28231.1 aminoglycoside phosphotransferase [Clostridium sartagoforme AAU1]
MKSRTKNLISNEEIEKLVRINFGEECKIGNIRELSGGMFNSAYSIERIIEKDKIVLKVSVAESAPILSYEKDIMKTEIEVYRIVHEKTNIPAPYILAYDFSRNHINSNYFFMTTVEGKPMNRVLKNISKDNFEAIKIKLASYFAQLHRVKGNYFGYFTTNEELQFTSWKEAFINMFSMILKDGEKRRVKLPYERMDSILKEKSVYLEEVKESSLVDYALWAGNVFLKKNGENYDIEAIIDFERAFWGDPLADFPPAFQLIKDIKKEEQFWDAYTTEMKIDKVLKKEDEIRLLLYKLYIFSIMAVETYRYNYFYGQLQKRYAKSIILRSLKELENI